MAWNRNETQEQNDKNVFEDVLKDTKIYALCVLERLNSADAEEVQAAMKEDTAIVDRF